MNAWICLRGYVWICLRGYVGYGFCTGYGVLTVGGVSGLRLGFSRFYFLRVFDARGYTVVQADCYVEA